VVSTHNAHYWAQENWVRHIAHQVNWRINVWCGILNDTIIGPVFFEGTLTGHRYETLILKGLVEYHMDSLQLAQASQTWSQHDGAAPHFAINKKAVLKCDVW
jgi:hypothetical protein